MSGHVMPRSAGGSPSSVQRDLLRASARDLMRVLEMFQDSDCAKIPKPIIADLIGMLDDFHVLVVRNAASDRIEAAMRRLRAAVLAAVGTANPIRLH
jgi:hypothetical protein